ncbi:Signal transduction histidine kinase [Sharpea azabuensis]|uniref:sensor histidine kinase n=1 Tax=Sharpea azabuensis TaxID=322505 RepID=UPI0008E567BF|nr:sensor histidine kinase [Sharpea azabuensis]SFD94087.1 Signal transduction histidine kinase [Sharpea azabuensis]SFK89135.1 Signal transduction histidine kinase [Sharpea azabuensis]
MKKAKRIYVLILSLLIAFSSFIMLSTYYGHESQTKFDITNSMISDFYASFILYETKQVDPTYEYLTFTNNVDEVTRAAINKEFQKQVATRAKEIEFNGDILYHFTNTSTNKSDIYTRKHKGEYYKLTVKFDSEGNVTSTGNNLSFYDFDLVREDLSDQLVDTYPDLGKNVVSINKPKNISLTITIPKDLKNAQTRDMLFYNEHDTSLTNALLAAAISMILIVIFVLLYPLEIVEDINPYKSVKDWYFLGHVIGISIMVAISALLLMATGSLGSSAAYSELKITTYAFPLLSIMSIAIIGIAVSLVTFGIKYILKTGLLNYLKTKTVIGAIVKNTQSTIHDIVEMPISKVTKKQIAKIISTQMVIVLLIILLPQVKIVGYSYFNDLNLYRRLWFTIWLLMNRYAKIATVVGLVVYGFVLYHWVLKAYKDHQENYHKLIKQAEAMSEGDFTPNTLECHQFDDLRNAMNDVSEGFKKAVDLETEAARSKSELITNVSHDLKTPITVVKNYTTLLKTTPLNDEQRQYVAELSKYTNHLTSLLDDLLDIAKASSGKMTFERVQLDIIALLKQSIVENNEILLSKNIEVVENFDTNSYMLKLDGDKTYRIFENLLTNISKYALNGTRFYVDAVSSEEAITISFKNISASKMNFNEKEIVERFVRGDSSRAQEGSGIGLAIVKSFMEAQDGEMEVSVDGDLFKVMLTFRRK